jgi:hypothetical protein
MEGNLMSDEIVSIYDLIYCDIAEAQDLLNKYPNAKIEDASDEVHEDRFSIRIDDTYRNYYKNLILTGVALSSLSLQMAMHEKPSLMQIQDILSEIKKEKEKLIT